MMMQGGKMEGDSSSTITDDYGERYFSTQENIIVAFFHSASNDKLKD